MSPPRTKTKIWPRSRLIGALSRVTKWVTVAPARIREALQAAGAEGYTFYSFITRVDHLGRSEGPPPFAPGGAGPQPRFELIYQLRDLGRRRLLRVRAFLPAGEESIDSVHDTAPPTGTSARSGTCSGSASTATPTWSGS